MRLKMSFAWPINLTERLRDHSECDNWTVSFQIQKRLSQSFGFRYSLEMAV